MKHTRKDIRRILADDFHHVRFTVSILTIAALMLVSLCSCGKKETSEFVDFAQIEKEFLETVNQLNWPEGAEVPTSLKGENADSFQVGYGETRASILWEIAWEKEWLDSYMSDSERAERALTELEKAPSMKYMSAEVADDATRRYFNDNLEKARLGDPSGFEESVRSSY